MKGVNFFLKFFVFSLLLAAIFLSSKSVMAQAVIDTINLPTGYSTNTLRYKNAIVIDLNDNVWIGFRNIGAGKFDGSSWTMYDTTNGLPSNNVLSIAFQGTNTWLGTTSGLAKYDGTSFTIYDSLNSPLTSNYIKSLFTNGSDLWIGTYDGLFHFDGTSWNHFNSGNSLLPGDTINCFESTGTDTIWMGTTNGIAGLHNGTWKVYLSFYPGFSRTNILNIKKDSGERLFVECISGKIFILKEDSIYKCQSLFPPFCTLDVPSGSLVGLNTFGNIALINQHSFEEINLDQIQSLVYETTSYSPMFGTSGQRQSVATLDNSGRIWYSSMYGNPTLLFAIDYQNALVPELPVNDCGGFLDVNNISARIHAKGTLFWDLIGTSQYEVPRGTGLHSIFADELWIGGLDTGSNLHIAAQTYRQSGNDFWPGPLDTTNVTVDSATSAQFNQIWKIERYIVTEFKNEFAAGNVTNQTYTVPDIILNWPAHGSGNYSSDLAPYVDVNNDGAYNPYDGDYPDMKGDQMLWCVFNDNYLPHRQTDGVSLGIEVQLSAYAYRCNFVPDTEEVVNYSTFYHYRIINRSDTDYSEVYMGRFTDVDHGNYLDDFVGCDSTLGIGYAYNGDNNDEGFAGYGYNPPMQNVVYLNQPFTGFIYFNGTSDPRFGYPANAADYYSYLQSRWRTDVHLTYGGNGYGGNDSTNFMYPSNPFDTSSGAWNETTSGFLPDDRKFLTSTGPFNFPAHSEIEFDLAYVWTRDETQPNGLNSSWAKNVHDILKIKEWYANDSFPCSQLIGIAENDFEKASLELYPNPASNTVTILAKSKNAVSYTLAITDIMGRVINSRQISANHKTQINLDNFSPGIYFVGIKNKDSFAVRKLVKQ